MQSCVHYVLISPQNETSVLSCIEGMHFFLSFSFSFIHSFFYNLFLLFKATFLYLRICILFVNDCLNSAVTFLDLFMSLGLIFLFALLSPLCHLWPFVLLPTHYPVLHILANLCVYSYLIWPRFTAFTASMHHHYHCCQCYHHHLHYHHHHHHHRDLHHPNPFPWMIWKLLIHILADRVCTQFQNGQLLKIKGIMYLVLLWGSDHLGSRDPILFSPRQESM